MRRFLVPPELAPSVALSREVKELESDLERRRLAAVAAEEEANKAGLAASLGLTWPLPKRGRGPPSRQRQYEEALCRAIDQGVLPEEIVTKVVPVWWKQGNPLVAPAEEMVLESCGAAEDGIEELDQPEDVEGAGPVKKRKLHRAPLEVKEWLVEFVEHKMQKSGWTRAQCVRHVQFLCPDVFEQVREDTVRRWKGELEKKKAKVSDARGRPKTPSHLALTLLADVTRELYAAGLAMTSTTLRPCFKEVLSRHGQEHDMSARWIRRFLREINMTYRVASAAKQGDHLAEEVLDAQENLRHAVAVTWLGHLWR